MRGIIDMLVPPADVGKPPVGPSLFSVTAHTVSQSAAAGSYDCLFGTQVPITRIRQVKSSSSTPAGRLHLLG